MVSSGPMGTCSWSTMAPLSTSSAISEISKRCDSTPSALAWRSAFAYLHGKALVYTLVGDEWVISGQKVWTSGAHYSDIGEIICRTDPDLPKHKGLTMFFLDMKSPGVEVRPIKQASGASDFNEVYFTDVRISDSERLGEVGASAEELSASIQELSSAAPLRPEAQAIFRSGLTTRVISFELAMM